VERYEPTGTGESPLAGIPEWVNTTCPKCGGPAKRETNTMPQWAGSCWYFLRYCDPNNSVQLISKDKANYWMPIDLYVGGAEHAVLHLLYARFWIKFLYDIGVINFVEPFKRLFNQGTIYRNGAKMSKSRGNVVNPDTLVETYGTDSLRLYELFIGPPDVDSEWDDNGIEGVYRFINRTWNVFLDNVGKNNPTTDELAKARHRLVRDVTERLENFRLNTIVSAFMSYTNFLYEMGRESIDGASLETFAILMAPFAPHLLKSCGSASVGKAASLKPNGLHLTKLRWQAIRSL
jgi:leucyl-tRNA synthetase